MLLFATVLLLVGQEPVKAPNLNLGAETYPVVFDLTQKPTQPHLLSIPDIPVALAQKFKIQPAQSGVYAIEFRSYDFDPCLFLFDAAGKLVAEDNDGLVELHAQLVVELVADVQYELQCCGLFQVQGEFQLSLTQGMPTPIPAVEQAVLGDQEAAARLAYIEKRDGAESRSVFECLSDHGGYLLDTGRLDDAKIPLQRAYQLALKLYGIDSEQTADVISYLAHIYRVQGNFSEAEPLLIRALEIDKKTLGINHPYTAISHNNYSILLKNLGHYEEAIEHCQRALSIREKLFGMEHPDTATSMNNLATLYYAQGSFDLARPIYEKALQSREKLLGEKHPLTGQSLNNLAALEKAAGELLQAEKHYRRAMAIYEEVLSPGHPQTAATMNNLAVLLGELNDVEGAQKLLQRALEIRENALGHNHPSTANTLNNLGALFKANGKLAEALPLLERAHRIRANLFGDHHPLTAISVDDLADVHVGQGHYELAAPLRELAFSSALQYLLAEFPTMTEAARIRQLMLTANPESFLAIQIQTGSKSLATAYPLFLTWKGMATRLQMAGMELTRQVNSAETISLKGQIQANAKQLSQQVFLPASRQPPNHAAAIAELRNQRRRLERELNRRLGTRQILQIPTVAEIQKSMPEGSVLIDFFVGKQVYAWVLKPSVEPELVHLGQADALRTAVQDFLKITATRGGKNLSTGPDTAASALRNLLWQPLQAQVGDATIVIISPDSFLCELPFGVIPTAPNSYLLEKHRFVYSSDATRIATTAKTQKERKGSILAIGDVNYYSHEKSRQGITSPIFRRSNMHGTWLPLNGTREELQAIRAMHEHVLRWESELTQLDDVAASEERVRQSLPGHRYIHIATHGYFEPDHLPSLLRDGAQKMANIDLGEQIQAVGALPSLLSGLVFAGVNADPQPNRDDGYLSAEEIQHIDLSECDLAVLSACETALGSTRAGEGLMSLRRAFEIAGAKTVISSLWKINDQTTAKLMMEFYHNYWQKGMTKVEALHQAKLEILRQNRNLSPDQKGAPMPSTWGALVLSGDWR